MLISLINFSAFAQDSVRVLSPVPIFAKKDSVLRIAIISSSIPHFEFSARKMEDLGVTDVGEALNYVPGIQLRDYGGIGGIKTIGYRSLGANHTAVQVDGQLLSNAQTGTINLSSFELFGLEQLSFSSGQVVDSRSSATAFSQANTIALTSVLASRPNHFRLGFYSNSTTINAFENGFYTQSKFGKHFFGGVQGLLRFGSGEYAFTWQDNPELGEQTRQNTRLFNYRLRSVIGYQNQFTKLILSAYYLNNEQELPGAAVLYNPSNDQKLWNEEWRFNLNQSFIKKKWSVQSHLDYQSNYTRYFDPFYLNLQGFVDARYQLVSQSAGFMLARSFRFPAEKLFFGLDLAGMSLNANKFDDSPFRIQQNGVVGGSTVFGKFKLEANLSTLYATDRTNEMKGATYFKIAPFIAAAFAPTKRSPLRLRAFYKNTFRLPTFNDLYYNFIGNPNLKPEDAQLIDLGITVGMKRKSVFFELTGDVYYNQIENKIIAIPTKDLFNWSMQNIGTVSVKGLDLTGFVSFDLNDFKLQIATNQSFNQSLDRTDREGMTFGHQLPYTPFYTANYGLTVSFHGYSFSSNVLYNGYRYSLNENIYSNLLPAFTTLNLGISKRVIVGNNNFLIDVKAFNILNKNYEIIRSFPMPGRYYQLRLKYTLDK